MKKYNYMRRGMGIVLCGLPVWLVMISIGLTLRHSKPDGTTGLVLLGGAGAIALLNLHLSYLRPWLYYRKQKSMDGYSYVSGIPGLGTVAVIAAVLFNFQHLLTGILAICILIADTGGLPWFLIMTWKDSSLWEGENKGA